MIDVTMRFREARLPPFRVAVAADVLQHASCKRLWLVAFVHFVRVPGIIICDHLGGFTAKEGLFMFANKALEGIVLRTGTQQLKFAIVGREAHTCTTVVTPAFEEGQWVFVVRCPACGRASSYSLNYGALRE